MTPAVGNQHWRFVNMERSPFSGQLVEQQVLATITASSADVTIHGPGPSSWK